MVWKKQTQSNLHWKNEENLYAIATLLEIDDVNLIGMSKESDMVLETWKQNGKRQHKDKPGLNTKFDTWNIKIFMGFSHIN